MSLIQLLTVDCKSLGCLYYTTPSIHIYLGSPQNLHINPECISRYQSTTTATLEVHQQPSALNFKASCLMETAIIRTSILGLQRKVCYIIVHRSMLGPFILMSLTLCTLFNLLYSFTLNNLKKLNIVHTVVTDYLLL